jgi:gliding motility-associated-like protein
VFELGDDQTICEGETITLSLPVEDGWSVEWNTGDEASSIEVSTSGQYSAEAMLDGCPFSDAVFLTVEELPIFDLGPDISKCEDLPAVLVVDRSDVSVIWQDGSTDFVYEALNPGNYTVEAMSPAGCIYSDEIQVRNRDCISFNLYVPNAFSPNGDGRNDFFQVGVPVEVILHSYEMHIFDRWGNEVFSTNDVNSPWDGRMSGQEMRSGVYVYSVKIVFSDDYMQNKERVISGSFTIVR